jgi:signal transduction histidine kinase
MAMLIHFQMYKKQQRELEKAREEALAAKDVLARENDALEQLNRMKSEFLGNISHELKTPLAIVSGYAQLSERLFKTDWEAVNKDDMINKMRFISSEAERLALMVEQILDVTRIEEGRMQINPVTCHTDEIIHSTIQTYFPILNKNENKLEIRIENNLPVIKADPLRISQVIINLIANAIRFTASGVISVSAKNSKSCVEISVTDTGTGIAKEKLPHVFERYNTPNVRIQGKETHDGRDTGTGLGLFICKYIIEEHGGEIAIESEPCKGTVVRFTVPAAIQNIYVN